MRYIEHPDLRQSVRGLFKKGGPYQKAANSVSAVIGRITHGESNPFHGFKLTKHGETRIPKCVKYDLARFCRLVIVSDAGYCYLLYAGSHDDCERWINSHRGFTPAVNSDGELVVAATSGDDLNSSSRVERQPDLSMVGKLYNCLPDADFDFIVEGLPRTIARKIEDLEPFEDHAELNAIVKSISELPRRNAVNDVFELLNAGDVKTAQTRVALLRGNLSIPKLDDEIINGESLRLIPTDSPQYAKLFEHFVRTADYKDWMVFMHPEQETVSEAEYAGAAKLTGVSGSGKTCIVVKRAIVLARRYPGERILVLTLNRPLATLIEELVSVTCDDHGVRERIQVIPFFRLCQELLKEFEPENTRLYDDVTWKSKEHIDEVWREFYRCEVNVRDAACMLPVHDSLISRGIDAESYIREEFDWIRSAVPFDERSRYLEIDRTGRSYPLGQRFREVLLEGLEKWETKMRFVGITDYLGITTALFRYQEQLAPRFRCVLVDECQDFGTTELKLITRLVAEGSDNIFFCGDAAQRVSWKHQSLVGAGVIVPGARSRRIEQNYRNSRDVLKAAYNILYDNLTEEMMDNEDFEILDPKFANFGGSVPLLLETTAVTEEISYAVAYAESEIGENSGRKACIAICGHSLYEIQEYGNRVGIPVLDGTLDLASNSLFFSDLEHTKGFEFDLMCVVNVREGIIPEPAKPELEQSRDLAKLYVAMTRAKLQLVLSYSGEPSIYVKKTSEFLHGQWTEFVAEEDVSALGSPPSLDHLRRSEGDAISRVGLMTGEQFLYTSDALGLSSRLIEKLRALVTGRRRIEGSTPVEWRDISEAARDTGRNARSRQQFGPETIHDFFSLLDSHGLRPRRVRFEGATGRDQSTSQTPRSE